MINELSTIRQLLNQFNNSIRYCHWKSNQHFHDALLGIDDLDILIDRKQYAEVVKLLGDLNFKRFYIPASRMYVGIEDYLGFDAATGKIFHLHLHSQMMLGEKHLKGIHFPIEDWLLSRRRWDEEHGAYLTTYFDELLLLILRTGIKIRKRNILSSKVLGNSSMREYQWLLDNCNDFDAQLESVDWLTDRIKQMVKNIHQTGFSWLKCMKLKCYIYSDLAIYSRGCGVSNTFERNKRELQRIVMELKKRSGKSSYSFLRRRLATGGLTIAFLGSDGAGKSSSISEIYSWLNKMMDVRYFYLGSGDGPVSILRAPVKLALKIAQTFGVVKKANNFKEDIKPHQSKNKKLGLARKLWIYTLSRERVGRLKKANRCRMRGFIVLTDRYPQTEFEGACDGKRLAGQKGLAARKEDESFRLASLCPPDIVIKLIVSPEVACSRKPGEIDPETSAMLTERIKNIKFSDKTVSVQINSDQAQEKVWLDIKNAIWNNL